MLCLPNGNPLIGGIGTYSEYYAKYDTDEYSPYYKVSTTNPALQVKVVLSFLASDNLAEWYGDMTPGQVSGMNFYLPRYWQPLFEATAHAHFNGEHPGKYALSYNDFHCDTCDHWVSKTLDPAHWESICLNCQKHNDECECCPKCSYSNDSCECCQICGEGPNWCECCSYCENTFDDCTCDHCEDCGSKVHYCSCSYGGGSAYSFGQTKVAPWTTREDNPIGWELPTISDCDNANLDPVQLAANFYLLDAIKNAVRFSDVVGASDRIHTERDAAIRSDSMLSALKTSADREYARLVETVAPSFLAYAISAVGGELRYHRAVSKVQLPTSRDKAWDKFVGLVQTKGAETLFEADKLFREFGGGSYGGAKWGAAAKVVGQYLNGTMPDWLFVDRVFTLQHNGGCFLNKVHWAKKNNKRWGLSHMQYVLNAHAGKDHSGKESGTDWDLLCALASPAVAQMFRMTERSINRVAKRWGGYLPPVKRSETLRYA